LFSLSIEQLTTLIEPQLDQLGYELVELQLVKEGNQKYLRLFIDQPQGIGLSDCELVSRKIEALLDEEDPISGSYVLEVSSPGLERPLKKEQDFERFSGKPIKVKTFAPLDGRKTFEGTLIGLKDQEVRLETEYGTISVPLKDIAKANLVFKD